MSDPFDRWGELERRGPDAAVIGDTVIRRGSRVRLRPRDGGDVFDLALGGRLASIEAIEEDADGRLHLAVTLDDDPGRDLGTARVLGHRFFFGVDEVEPVEDRAEPAPPRAPILVAGIGNVFLGDDGFGVEVVRRLTERGAARAADVRDFGIRGLDLAYALQEGYEAVVFVDAAPRGEPPGTVSLVEAELEPAEAGVETHGMDPLRVLGLARALGHVPRRVLVVACEPAMIPDSERDEDLVGELSPAVAAAVEGAVWLVERVVSDLTSELSSTGKE